MSLSVAIIARNSSDVIERCLESVKCADEIVVLDTGSSDNTIEIARRYTDKVYEYWGCNEGGEKDGLLESFADARNKCNEYVTSTHILTIDTDEVLEADIEELKKFDGESLSIRCISAATGEEHRQPRLYKNDPSIRWYGAAHNYLKVGGVMSNHVIRYHTNEQKKSDPDRTMRILQREVKRNSGPREMYYLAKEYYKRGWAKKAEKIFKRYVLRSEFAPEKADAYLMLSRVLAFRGKHKEAVNTCLAALAINPQFKEALQLMGDLSGNDVQRIKWHHLSTRACDSQVLFSRPDKRMRVTIISPVDFAGSGYRMALAVRKATDNNVDVEAITINTGSAFGVKTGASVYQLGWDVVRDRLDSSNIVHVKGDWPVDMFYDIEIRSPKIHTVCGSIFRRGEGLDEDVAMGKYPLDLYRADIKTAITPDLCYTDEWHYMPFPWLNFNYRFKRGRKFRVMHVPSTASKKGTDMVREAFEMLGDKIEPVIVENIPHDEFMKLKATAHIYLDQFKVKAYGNSAVEALSMGIPVLSSIDRSLYPEGCPVMAASKVSPEGIAEAIERMLNWGFLEDLSRSSFEFAQMEHGTMGERWVKKYLELYE